MPEYETRMCACFMRLTICIGVFLFMWLMLGSGTCQVYLEFFTSPWRELMRSSTYNFILSSVLIFALENGATSGAIGGIYF